MFELMFVKAALQLIGAQDISPERSFENKEYLQDSVTSLLIHDIFGGEILKTPQDNDWHFYNRINGERIDFAATDAGKVAGDNTFADLPAIPDETFNYVTQEDYSTLYIRFINAYEAAVGLEK